MDQRGIKYIRRTIDATGLSNQVADPLVPGLKVRPFGFSDKEGFRYLGQLLA